MDRDEKAPHIFESKKIYAVSVSEGKHSLKDFIWPRYLWI